MRTAVRIRPRLALLLAALLLPATAGAQDNDPETATTPDLADVLNDTRRALILETVVGNGFATRSDVYVSETPPGAHVGDPAQLRIEWYDASGARIGGRNAWNPRWEFVRFGSDESRRMLPEAIGAFEIPFSHEIASVSVVDIEADLVLLETDVRNVVATFCLASPEDPNCEGFNESPDGDGDGIDDSSDNCPAEPNVGQEDADGDGIGDVCDADDDNDGVEDTADNCPLTANPDQADFDGDGQGDVCDPDDDNDGVEDTADNCPLATNPDQADFDGDGQGDVCDPDDDNDGVADGGDICPQTTAGATVDPNTGCSLAQLCPCEGPRGSTKPWRNHGKYVSCVARSSETFVELGLLTETEKDILVSEAAASNCGVKNQ